MSETAKIEASKENIFVVLAIDEQYAPIYAAGWPEACHEHINDALDSGIDASKWIVREYAPVV